MRAAALALALVAVAGCHRPGAPHATVRRIVSLSPSWTEDVYAVGAGAMLVGRDEFSDYPAAAKAVPNVGTGIQPSLERVLALRPDLVLVLRGASTPELASDLGRFGIRVLVSDTQSLDGVIGDIDRLGDAIGRKTEAARVSAGLRARLAAVRARVASLPRPKALLVEWTDPLVVIGSHSFLAEALAAAGGDNVAGDSPQPYPQYSVERLLARAPAVIIVAKQYNGPPLEPLLKLTALPAVRDGRVYRLDADILFRPGPRVVDGVEALARMLHP